MITKEQALTAEYFHENHSAVIKVGPRGGLVYPKVYNWHRNGKTKTWKTQPDRFEVPIKYGMRSYGHLTNNDAHMFHTAENCPKMIKETDLR